MKATMLGMLLAVLGGAGCAHGVINGGEGRDLRGAARLEQSARVLVVGPASSVHTSAADDPAVALYLVDARNGDDRDCNAPAAKRTAVTSESAAHIQIPQGRALCAAKAAGAVADVLWHGHADGTQEMVASR